MQPLYKNIKTHRMLNGWSQQHLADIVGYRDRSSIAKIESGLVDLSRSKIEEFAKAFRITPAQLMGLEQEPSFLELVAEDNGMQNLANLLKQSRKNGKHAKSANANPEQMPFLNILTPTEAQLLDLHRQLNEEGQTRLYDYADDLVSSGKYMKTDPPAK